MTNASLLKLFVLTRKHYFGQSNYLCTAELMLKFFNCTKNSSCYLTWNHLKKKSNKSSSTSQWIYFIKP